MQFSVFIALVIVFVLMLFSVQNQTIITLTFFKWTFESSLAFISALTFATGMLTGICLVVPAWWRKARVNKVQRKRIQELERDVLNVAEYRDASHSD
jgi:uncharacterized integral membrane protein